MIDEKTQGIIKIFKSYLLGFNNSSKFNFCYYKIMGVALSLGPEGIIATEEDEDDDDDELSVDSLLAATGSNSADNHEVSWNGCLFMRFISFMVYSKLY